MKGFLTSFCFPSARKRKDHDEFQLTPLGPDPTRRDMMNTKLKQNLGRPRPNVAAAGGPWLPPPPKPLANNNPYAQHPSLDADDPVRRAEVDAMRLFAQAGLPTPDFGGYTSNNNRMRMPMPMPPPARLPVERPRFEDPRAAPTPPSASSSIRRDYGRSLTTPHGTDRGFSATSSSSSAAAKGKSKAKPTFRSDLHPAVQNDKWYRERLSGPPPPPKTKQQQQQQQLSRRPRSDNSSSSRPSGGSSNNNNNNKLSGFLGLSFNNKESERDRERRVQAERERERQARLDKEKMAAKIQRGREREREREYYTRKAMERVTIEEKQQQQQQQQLQQSQQQRSQPRRPRQSEAGPSVPRPQRRQHSRR